jgi:hypothetical protein
MVKAKACANSSTQRSYTPLEEASSSTAATEAILITAMLDLKQRRDIITLSVLNAFIQTRIPDKKDKIATKIREALVGIPLKICPRVCSNYVIIETKNIQKIENANSITQDSKSIDSILPEVC